MGFCLAFRLLAVNLPRAHTVGSDPAGRQFMTELQAKGLHKALGPTVCRQEMTRAIVRCCLGRNHHYSTSALGGIVERLRQHLSDCKLGREKCPMLL